MNPIFEELNEFSLGVKTNQYEISFPDSCFLVDDNEIKADLKRPVNSRENRDRRKRIGS